LKLKISGSDAFGEMNTPHLYLWTRRMLSVVS